MTGGHLSVHAIAPNQQFLQGVPKATIPVGALRALPALTNKDSSLPTSPHPPQGAGTPGHGLCPQGYQRCGRHSGI